MTEDRYHYFISLLHQQEYDVLEDELKYELVSLYPSWEQENIPDMDTDDAFDIAEGYVHD
ncbi:MAG: hypothetical protein HRU12_06825 [Phaeodactylibacter sp.]|nr:hypothetical protein [Phaeodactylibacter sp.]